MNDALAIASCCCPASTGLTSAVLARPIPKCGTNISRNLDAGGDVGHGRANRAALIIILLSATSRLPAQQVDSLHTATLAGIVRDSTGAPIEDVTVGVGRTRFGARTSAAGWFTIEGVPPGQYNVRFERLGYGTLEFSWHAKAGEQTEIAIELAAIPRALDTVLVAGKASRHPHGHALVTGIVVDSAGTPLPDAQIQIIGSGRFAATAADGQFLFPDLAAGSYLLRVRRLGFAAQTVPLTVGSDGRHTLAIRMRALGLLLDTVQVRAKSGFGKGESAWRDFDARLRWGSQNMRSVILMGPELRKLGKAPLDIVLRHSPAAVKAGVVPGLYGQRFRGFTRTMSGADGSVGVAGDAGVITDDEASCILVNGRDAVYRPLRSFHADELVAVEAYAARPTRFVTGQHQETDFSKTVEARMSSIDACAHSLLGGHPPYYVVWLKGAR